MELEFDPSTALRAARYVAFALSLALILRMLAKYRRVRSVSRKSCAFAVVFPVLMLLTYAAIVGSSLPSIALAGLFAAGLALGLWQGIQTDVWIEGGLPRARNTIWFLLVWTVSFATMQALVHIGDRLGVNIGIGAMMATTAVAVGSQGLILFRLSRGGLSARPAGARATGVARAGGRRFCSSCGNELVRGDRYCRTCRAEVR